MVAQVFGELRQDATHGERIVLKHLRENLPKEFSIYVECPLPSKHRIQRYPDFIILTNYGVIVLEVKDWVRLRKADRYHAEVITRNGETRQEKNPVQTVREIAIELENLLKKQGQEVDWGCAVILPNLPPTLLANLRIAWGESQVLGQDDLRPNIILKRLSATRPSWSNHSLTREQLRSIRQIINPLVEFEHPEREPIILDETQEQIVLEPTRIAEKIPQIEKPAAEQLILGLSEEEAVAELPMAAQKVIQSLSIRLVRGPAGSGKTIVLTQRARYLAAQYPQWNILVLTYNRPLCQQLQQILAPLSNVSVNTLHALCTKLWQENGRTINLKDDYLQEWLKKHQTQYPIIRRLGLTFLLSEIAWIKDMGFEAADDYIHAERRGLGQHRLSAADKTAIYQLMAAFDSRRKSNEEEMDWIEFPSVCWKAICAGELKPPLFDAVLIDEAQDFAPLWIKIVKAVLKQDGLLFLADDPSQSVFRFFSWRQKGIEVVGRTRHLKLPYRNTYEIYRAAQALIENDQVLKEQLQQDEFLPPLLNEQAMRHGPKPILVQQINFEREGRYLSDQVHFWLQKGVKPAQIAVLHPRRNRIEELNKILRGTGVNAETLLRAKGLEFEIVLISQVHLLFENADNEERLSHALRQLFMAMTRARQQLVICYQGTLPRPLEALGETVEWVIG